MCVCVLLPDALVRVTSVRESVCVLYSAVLAVPVRVMSLCVSSSLQCGRQIAQLKDEYEESKKTLEGQAAELRKVHTHLGICQS